MHSPHLSFQWFVAIHGARPFNRIVARIFRARHPSLEIHFFGREKAAIDYLKSARNSASPIRKMGISTPRLSTSGPTIPIHLAKREDARFDTLQLDGSDIPIFALKHWHFQSEDGSFEVNYALVDHDILLIRFKGKINTGELMKSAIEIVHTVYDDLGVDTLYVIRHSIGLTGVSLGARAEFLEYLKHWGHREKLCIHVGSPLTRMLQRTMRLVAPKCFAGGAVPPMYTRQLRSSEHIQQQQRALRQSPLSGQTMP